jgi:hypothetical protein
MKYKIKYINTPPNHLLIEWELIPYISMTYSTSIKSNVTKIRTIMRLNNKYINTPPNPLLIEGELNTYISMTYSPSIKRGLGGVL